MNHLFERPPDDPDEAEDRYWSKVDARYEDWKNDNPSMGAMKNYLLTILHLCSDQQFGQDAVEWAISTGRVTLSYNLDQDLRTIMGEPGKPETGMYCEITEAYRRACRERDLAQAA